MLSKRIIPCLDVRNGRLTKGIKFKGNVDIGDPVESARPTTKPGATRSSSTTSPPRHEDRGIFLDVVEKVASASSSPFPWAGASNTVRTCATCSWQGPRRSR